MIISISSSVDLSSRRINFNSYLLNKWVGKLLFPVFNKIKSTINLQFDNLFIIANGALDVATTYTQEVAIVELSGLKRFLPKLRKMVSKLEANNFFNDEVLREKAQLTLDKFYALEGELRLKAFSTKKNKQKQSSDFIDALAGKSKAALISVFEKSN